MTIPSFAKHLDKCHYCKAFVMVGLYDNAYKNINTLQKIMELHTKFYRGICFSR